MKGGLDRRGKKIDKSMHWNVALDAFPGSAMLVCV